LRQKTDPIQTGDGNYFASRVQNHKRHGEARTVALRGAAPRPPWPPIFNVDGWAGGTLAKLFPGKGTPVGELSEPF